MRRVLVIGLDGATWNLLKPFVDEGKLPTFKRLIDEGAYGELESTIPSWSIPAWNSITTGKNPGKLGFFSFLSRDYGCYDFKPDFLYSKERNIWDILSEAGKKIMVVNVPNVHKPPARAFNGLVVVGFLYLDKENLTYPKTLKKKLDEICGGYEIDVLDVDGREASFGSVEKRFEAIKSMLRRESDRKYVERVSKTLEKRFEAVENLLKRRVDFAFVVFVAPDRLQHRFWLHREILLDCYKRIDDGLEKLLRMHEDTIVIIISDHGFGPKKRVFNINDWLLKEGYLKLKSENRCKLTGIGGILRKIKNSSFVEALTKLLPLRLPQSLEEKVDFLVVDEADIDWTRTKVFTQPSSEMCGDLYLNLRGRETKGNVNPQEYEKVREELIQKLRNLRDPKTKEKVSATVHKREDIYQGEYIDRAPDLTIQADDSFHGFDTKVGHDQTFTDGTGGEHRTNGVFLAYGPDVKNGTRIKGANVYDIAPTILHIFNIAVPEDMDGKVLKEIFTPESELARREIRYHAAAGSRAEEKERERVSPEEEEKVKKRLRSLGYI